MLTVYKASAGSGKTFQLVVEYIHLLILNTKNYKHILAVTFTNKATNEMKSRILEQLSLLAGNEDSDYLEPLLKKGHSESFVRKQAKDVLKYILHDYNRFSISTIDAFTQRIIKAFNRELGISPHYLLELDSEMVLSEAVDNLLAKIGEDKKLLKWLKEFSREKITEGLSQRIENDIRSLGNELFKEKFQLFFPEEGESVYSREKLEDLGKELTSIKAVFENTLKKMGEEAVELMADNQLAAKDFSGGESRSIGAFFIKLSAGSMPNFTKTVRESGELVEKWYTKTNKRKQEIHDIVENALQPKLLSIIEYFDENSEKYHTALAVSKQIRMLGILTNLKEEIRVLLKEKGMLQISDSNLLLNKIIGDSDAPFIYEKAGNRFKHFMLDEFQDTSELQWNNFKPLVTNALAEGHDNLVVGDVKQSIYRWRNSNWNILAEQINNDFPKAQLKHETLIENWRSDQNIIDFNNAVFQQLKSNFEEVLFKDTGNGEELYLDKFRNIYSSIQQKPGRKADEKKGYVNIRFLPGEDFSEHSTPLLVEQVKQLQDSGIRASEIAILIRRNKEGTPVIEEFLKAAGKPENESYNLSVLSNESLFLHASRGVLFIMHIIELLIDKNNDIAKAALLHLWLNELKPKLHDHGFFMDNNSQTGQNEQSIDENFSILFEAELNGTLELLKTKILHTSLDETITLIASQFKLFELESELPFIQTLTDKAGELKASLSNDLSNLLLWWNDKGFLTSVSVNEEVDSIRLLTVHKSKGLEFKAVLIPYLDWGTSWNGNFAPILWCRPTTAPFNQFPLLPVKAGTIMEKSYFKDIYYEEKVNYIIDTFNLVYVAFTRARSVLMINCPAPPRNQKTVGKSIYHLFNAALVELTGNEKFRGCFNDEQSIFSFGKITDLSSGKEKRNSVILKRYQFNDFSGKLKLRSTGDDFLVEDEQNRSVKNRGKIIHDILSGIETDADINNACYKAMRTGTIDEQEMQDIRETLHKSISGEEIRNWFDGSYTVITERNLLTRERILRPDRIMVSDEETVVIDYKTGDKKSDSYNRQVKRYAQTLKKTGAKKVSGYIWYISLNEVEKVCELGQ